MLLSKYRDFDVICVDDGLKDSSKVILSEYAEKDMRFKVLVKENSGARAALNRAMRSTCGEFVLFLDSDDYLEQTQTLAELRLQKSFLEKKLHVISGSRFLTRKVLQQTKNTELSKKYYKLRNLRSMKIALKLRRILTLNGRIKLFKYDY